MQFLCENFPNFCFTFFLLCFLILLSLSLFYSINIELIRELRFIRKWAVQLRRGCFGATLGTIK